jgi:predicted thioesterase
MKSIPFAYTTTFETTVTPEMTVDFEQPDPRLGKVHPVYATYWLVKHLELVSRKIILPFLEEGEDGVGFEVKVRHLASALPGMRVSLKAEHVKTEKNRVYARCEVTSELGDKIAEAQTTQVILPQARIEENFATLRARWEEEKSRG